MRQTLHYTSVLVLLVLLSACDGNSTANRRPSNQGRSKEQIQNAKLQRIRDYRERNPRAYALDYSSITLWWDAVPKNVSLKSVVTGQTSNIAHSQYVGPDSCKECHATQHADWTDHPHRLMNAVANEETVVGDFSGRASINYLGGTGQFYRENGEYRMRLERAGVLREYNITQTIGSRFFQYYIGKQLVGPESESHYFYREDHVLPFGYWLEYKGWVPIVHVSDRVTCDSYTNDPYIAADVKRYVKCNSCHTTFALGDRFIRDLDILGRGSPYELQMSFGKYLQSARPDMISPDHHVTEYDDRTLDDVFGFMSEMEAKEHAVTLGISCEACHLGLREHVDDKSKKPVFHPHDPNLLVSSQQSEDFVHKSTDSLNWICSRCHVGPRPQLKAGMATWNSTEASDAFRGSCYSELTCIDCHPPHQAIGPEWTKTPEQDDASCLKCHSEYEPTAARQAHTHHMPGSEGSRCMNCHMPKMNEGLQDVVRTHMIFSPTNASMIESNQPNACNMCHTDKSIDWTVEHLDNWYEAKFDAEKLAKAYESSSQPAAVGWLNSKEEAVRLLAADTLIRQRDRNAVPELLKALDDHYLINRQFAYVGLKEMLGVDPEKFGYRFYMTPAERAKPLARFREAVLSQRESK